MADASVTLPRADAGTAGTAWLHVATPVRIAVLYAVARCVTTGFFLLASAMSTSTSRFGAHPPLGTLLMGWDAQWYWYIAVHGYPTTLPTDPATGAVVQNQWAFMPVYPYLARLLGGTGIGWTVAAVAVSLIAGYLACLVLYGMLRLRIGAGRAMWAVLLFANAPLAAMFQIGYAESLFVLLLLTALWCVQRRRYMWLWGLIPAMGFTRPGVLAFALLLGLHGLRRLVRRDDGGDGLPAGRRRSNTAIVVHVGVLAAWALAVGLSWPVIAGRVTGRGDAYLATELSWRAGWVTSGAGTFAPLRAFVQGAEFWFRIWGMPAVLGVVALVAVVAAFAAVLVLAPPVRRLGTTVRLWSASYAAYLLAVFFPQSSLFRLLVPFTPLIGAAVPRSRWGRPMVLLACLGGQAVWIVMMYGFGTTFWQIP